MKSNKNMNIQSQMRFSPISDFPSTNAFPNTESIPEDKQFHNSSIIDLHKDLKTSSWASLYRHLQYLSTHTDLVIPSLTQTDPIDQSTPLHTAVWKAPPSLALQLIRLLPTSKELNGIIMAKDCDNNTALHLCCANLDFVALPEGEDSFRNRGGGNISVIKALIRAAPRALSMQNAEGDTPLHLLVSSPACCASSSSKTLSKIAADIVSTLLDSCLDAAILQDSSGATPLHVAIANNAHDAIIAKLVEAAPMTCRVEDDRNMLPLHYVAAFHNTGINTVRKIADCHPEAIIHYSINGDTPLHLAVSNAALRPVTKSDDESSSRSLGSSSSICTLNGNIAQVVELLMGNPKQATPKQSNLSLGENDERKKYRHEGALASVHFDEQNPLIMTNREKLTPLHCCALFDAPPVLANQLMGHPLAKHAASMTNAIGATPLHLAAAQPDVTRSIATIAAIGTPEAAAVVDRSRRTPLHIAAQNVHSTKQLINTVAEFNPEAAAVKTQRGHLPLHLAAQSQAKEPVVKALIKVFPQAAEARNKSGNTPLHDAAKYRASAAVVKLLIDTYPHAVYIQNQYGNLPLHCATAYQAPKDVVRLLLEAWPDGAAMQNRNQDTPLHFAAIHANTVDHVQPIIDAAPSAMLLLNSSGQSPVDQARENNAPSEVINTFKMSADAWSAKAASDGWAAF